MVVLQKGRKSDSQKYSEGYMKNNSYEIMGKCT